MNTFHIQTNTDCIPAKILEGEGGRWRGREYEAPRPQGQHNPLREHITGEQYAGRCAEPSVSLSRALSWSPLGAPSVVAKLKDGSIRAEVMENLDDYGANTSKNMFEGNKANIEFVQVMVVIDARPHLKINAISHKQFVEHVGTHDVAGRVNLEEVAFAKEFEFRAESTTLENAEREICKTLRLKDCQAWFVNDNNLCRKRPMIATDATELSGYLRYDAINKMLVKHMEDVNANKGRAAYSGKGADETDKFLGQVNCKLQIKQALRRGLGSCSVYRAYKYKVSKAVKICHKLS